MHIELNGTSAFGLTLFIEHPVGNMRPERKPAFDFGSLPVMPIEDRLALARVCDEANRVCLAVVSPTETP